MPIPALLPPCWVPGTCAQTLVPFLRNERLGVSTWAASSHEFRTQASVSDQPPFPSQCRWLCLRGMRSLSSEGHCQG